MPMTQDQIRLAHARAKQVVDGFAKVREQQARDVLKLAEELLAANRQLNANTEPQPQGRVFDGWGF